MFSMWEDLRVLSLFRVPSQHYHDTDHLKSNAAFAHHGGTVDLSSAIHEARSGPDQQQQQQERHFYRGPS